MAIRKGRHSTSWALAEAKAHLDEVIDEVEDDRAQTLLSHGEERAAIVPIDGWNDEPIHDLASFFASACLGEGELPIPPRTGTARDIDW